MDYPIIGEDITPTHPPMYRIAIIVPDSHVELARKSGVALGFSDMSEYSVRLSGTWEEPPTYWGLSTLSQPSFASIIKSTATLGHMCENTDGEMVCTQVVVPDAQPETLEAIMPFASLLSVMKSRIDTIDIDPLAQFNLLCEEHGVSIIQTSL